MITVPQFILITLSLASINTFFSLFFLSSQLRQKAQNILRRRDNLRPMIGNSLLIYSFICALVTAACFGFCWGQDILAYGMNSKQLIQLTSLSLMAAFVPGVVGMHVIFRIRNMVTTTTTAS